jgi:hypothetical protein
MSLRPPQRFSTLAQNPLQAALEAEVMQEKASTLSRAARRLEKALAALAAWDARPGQAWEREHEGLLAEAAEALWYLIIQRELMGLGGEERVCRDYRVPRAVRARLGVRKPLP